MFTINILIKFFRNPNQPVSVSTMWPKYNNSHQAFIELNKGENTVRHFLDSRPAKFWLEVLPYLLEDTDGPGTGGCVSKAGHLDVTLTFTVLYVLAGCFIYHTADSVCSLK